MISYLMQGGWPMIPLGFCSLAAVAIILERSFALRHGKIIDPRIVEVLQIFGPESSVEALVHACRNCGGAFAKIIEEVVRARELDPSHGRELNHSHALETMHATGRREVERMERGLIVLEIVAGISPLIGLLGTVLGMVTVFDAITAQGIGNPQVLSEGISEALISTVAGLCVAIPALALHSFFSKRVESLAIEMQDIATGFVLRLHTLQGRTQA